MKGTVNEIFLELKSSLDSNGFDDIGTKGSVWEYLKQLLENGALEHDAAEGSAKSAVAGNGLTDKQIRAIALEVYNNDLIYLACPRCLSSDYLFWDDMLEHVYKGQCHECDRIDEKIKYD